LDELNLLSQGKNPINGTMGNPQPSASMYSSVQFNDYMVLGC